MPCPFFDPATPFSWEDWPNPPRLPLGDPHTGMCTAQGGEVPRERVRTCCNTGYVRGACPSFPGGEAPDAVRFGILRREAGVVTIQYVIERNHYPFEDGTLELREPAKDVAPAAPGSTLERQARAFLASYLRRTV